MAIDRSAMKKQLKDRQEEQQKLKNRGVSEYESWLNIPEGMSQWSFKPVKDPGLNVGFDIVPFVAGSHYPTNGYSINSGDLTYVLDIWIHRNVGPGNKPVVCPLKNYDKPCPICEKRVADLAKQGNMETKEYNEFKKANGELWPSRRVVYNVIVRSDEKEEAKGIQIFEGSHHFLEKKLQQVAKHPRTGGLIPYPDPDEGKTIWMNFMLVEGDNWEVAPPTFDNRNYIIEDSEIEAAACLDDLITVHSYDKIKSIMGSGGNEEESHVSYGGPITEDDVPTFSNNRKPKPAIAETVPDPEPVKPEPVTRTNLNDTCPIGADFGKDFDEYVECDECNIRVKCQTVKEAPVEPEPEQVKTPARRKKLV